MEQCQNEAGGGALTNGLEMALWNWVSCSYPKEHLESAKMKFLKSAAYSEQGDGRETVCSPRKIVCSELRARSVLRAARCVVQTERRTARHGEG